MLIANVSFHSVLGRQNLDASFKCREPKYITQMSQEFMYSIIYNIAEVTISIHRVPTVGKRKPFHFDLFRRISLRL
jgi:hypothetical protein